MLEPLFYKTVSLQPESSFKKKLRQSCFLVIVGSFRTYPDDFICWFWKPTELLLFEGCAFCIQVTSGDMKIFFSVFVIVPEK